MGELAQADFSAGLVRSVARHLIPENGTYDIQDALLDDDGNAYLRGPTSLATSVQLGNAFAGLYEGAFAAGRRTVMIAGSMYAMESGSTVPKQILAALAGPVAGLSAQINQVMFLTWVTGTGSTVLVAYGGSLKGALYSTGTVSVTNGSTAVVGVGTSWVASVDPGMLLRIGTVVGVVASVNSNTSITLVDPWDGATAAGTAYVLWHAYTIAVVPNGGTAAVATVGGRLFFARGRTVGFSLVVNPASGYSRWYEAFAANDHHDFPADIVALAALRDRVFVFTKAGIYSISNGTLDVVDAFGNAQHRVERISGDVIARSAGAVGVWRDSLVIAALDGVYMLDASGQLELLSRSITPYWQALMKANSTVGQIATFRDHLFVPVGGQLLVARLDRRVSLASGKSAPWVRITGGVAAGMVALATADPYGAPKFIGGLGTSTPLTYMFGLTDLFAPVGFPVAPTGAAVDNPDGPVGQRVSYGLTLQTREFLPAEGFTAAYAHQMLLDYESAGGTLDVAVSKGERATAGSSPTFTALTTQPAGNFSSQAPRAIGVRKTARRLSFSFSTSGSCPGLRLRGFRVPTRDRGLQR